MEPKKLPPSLRPKARYVVFEIISDHAVTLEDFTAALWNSVLNLLGELAASECRIWVIKNLYDERAQRGVLKCAHDRVEHVRTALSLITMLGESKATIRVAGVTGTLKSARNKYLGMPDLRSYQT
ncbi:MAG: Rpp14/Pop5 family protein [Candidatus Aenigmatarchaeota archaeon]